MSTPDQYSVFDHYAGKSPIVLEVYQHLLIEMRKFGPVVEEPKKTSVHLVNKSALAGVVTRNPALILNLKSAAPIKAARSLHAERASTNRFHQEVKLTSPADLDPVLLSWLKSAYEMSG